MQNHNSVGRLIIAAIAAATISATIAVIAILRGLPDENESRIHVDLMMRYYKDRESETLHAQEDSAEKRSAVRKESQNKLKNNFKAKTTTDQCEKENNMNISSNKIMTLALASAVSAGVALVNQTVAADSTKNDKLSSLTAESIANVPARLVAWKNLDAEHCLGGRKTSEGYMRGKVVLVYQWDMSSEESVSMLARMEAVWASYKSKPFVLLASHCAEGKSADELKAFVKEKRLTFSVYEDAGLADDVSEGKKAPFLYLVDETGAICYKGTDERAAEERIVQTLTDMEAPKDVAMWQKYIDFELKTLPGRAFVRLSEFRKKFPKDAKKYEDDFKRLKNDSEVQKLVKLVTFAKMAKDFDQKNKKMKGKVTRVKIEMAIQKFDKSKLKTSKNELIVQETKNALADLKWALTNFPI